MIPKSLRRNGWRNEHLVLTILLLAAGVYVTLDAWKDMVRIALTDEESSQVFLAPVVAAWMVGVRLRRIRQCRPVGQWIGPLLIGIGWLLNWIGDGNLIQVFWHGGAVLVAIGCLITMLGRDVLARFFPAFLVLAFLVPVPGTIRQQIAIPLQTVTATVTQQILEVIGVNIVRSGNVLTVNGVNVAIAEACNGLRMVFALLLVSYAFAFSAPLRNYVRVIVVAMGIPAAILCNVIRLLPTVWLYGYRPQSEAQAFHDFGGWVMLPVAFLLLMGIIRALRWALVPVTYYTLAYE